MGSKCCSGTTVSTDESGLKLASPLSTEQCDDKTQNAAIYPHVSDDMVLSTETLPRL